MKELAPGVILWSGTPAESIKEEVIESTDVSSETSGSDEREDLKAKLKEAGISFGGNTSTAKLRELAEGI